MATPQKAAQDKLTEGLRATLPASVIETFVGGTHTRRFEDNLLPTFKQWQIDTLRQQVAEGSGSLLVPNKNGKRTFHAPYSSAALAVNAFGPWLGEEASLVLSGLTG